MESFEKQSESVEIDGVDNIAQLQLEANIKRMKTSETLASLVKYVKEHQEMDSLINGFNDPTKKNPYKRERINKCFII